MKVEVLDCSYRYQSCRKGHEYAVQGINCTIRPAQTFGIVGTNGAGKSTLISLLAGMIKPSEGAILVDGTNIYAVKSALAAYRKSLALVSQFPEDQFFAESLYHELAFGLAGRGLDQEIIRRRVHTSLREVGLEVDEESLRVRSPFALAQGEKRLISMASALVIRPKVLILDEPTAGLDAMASRTVWKLIDRLRQKRKMTIILVSHDLDQVVRSVDYLMVMHEGQALRQGSPPEVFSEPESIAHLGLKLPQMTILGKALEECGLQRYGRPIFEVQEASDVIRRWLQEKRRLRS